MPRPARPKRRKARHQKRAAIRDGHDDGASSEQVSVPYNPTDLAALQRYLTLGPRRVKHSFILFALLSLASLSMYLSGDGSIAAGLVAAASLLPVLTNGLLLLFPARPVEFTDETLLAHWRYVPEQRTTSRGGFWGVVAGGGILIAALGAGYDPGLGVGLGLGYMIVTRWTVSISRADHIPGQRGQVWVTPSVLCVDGSITHLRGSNSLVAVRRRADALPSLVFHLRVTYGGVTERIRTKSVEMRVPVPPAAESQAQRVQAWFTRQRHGKVSLR